MCVVDEKWVADARVFFFNECMDAVSRSRLFAAHFDDLGAEDESRLVFQHSDVAALMLPALQDSFEDGNGGHRLLWSLREVVQFATSPRQLSRAQELLDRVGSAAAVA